MSLLGRSIICQSHTNDDIDGLSLEVRILNIKLIANNLFAQDLEWTSKINEINVGDRNPNMFSVLFQFYNNV